MKSPKILTLFLCGDVMLGRGIDQILPYPSNPILHENYLTNALQYLQLAERKNGEIKRPVDFNYIWGEALHVLANLDPDYRIINLETSITTSEDWMPKGINYRMNPKNSPILSAAKIDVCVLANNHVLDWGEKGLLETLETLHLAGIKTAGAGVNVIEATTPAIIPLSTGRILFFSIASPSSGVPEQWSAQAQSPGVNFVPNFSKTTATKFKAHIQKWRQPGDIIVVSIHWGDNWGYQISSEQRTFAQSLIRDAGVNLIHGHSSHHIKGMEIYNHRLIIYGCGDFINDYEGISGYEAFRSDLPVMFFPSIDISTGDLINLTLVPLHLKKLRLEKASLEDVRWIKKVLNREGYNLNTHFEISADQSLKLVFDKELSLSPGSSR